MEIVNMITLSEAQKIEAAQILVEELPMGWATLEEAQAEIKKRLIPENTLLAAVEEGIVLGWGGILPQYSGNVMELHPLAVRRDVQKKGIGRRIVAALEDAARTQGALTMWLGADDEAEPTETSFGNVDLYDDFPRQLKNFQAGTHQTGFYQKIGYQIMGVLPDANGRGKPDIYMAKRL
ncbi:MAG: GNAT family N-acetyltransferase [Christensenellaceae bacterium]|jgi:aminoglycoside 6'-N-acetyltransferase I